MSVRRWKMTDDFSLFEKVSGLFSPLTLGGARGRRPWRCGVKLRAEEERALFERSEREDGRVSERAGIEKSSDD